jgi:hypothetical protein
MKTNSMIHDEEKIKELVSKYCLDVPRFTPGGVTVSVINAIKEYANHIRQKTIDEAIACVPQVNITREIGSNFWNDCIHQTIYNLEKLK